MDKILTLLDLHKQASQAQDFNAFQFIALNQTNQLVNYKQAVFWKKRDFEISLCDVSGNTTLDTNGSYAQWLKRFIKKFGLPKLKEDKGINVLFFSRDTVGEEEQAQWKEYAADHGAFMTLKTPEGDILGGLWLERSDPFNKAETALLEELCLLYSQTYSFLKLRKKSGFFSPWKTLKKHNKIAFLACIILSLLPTHLTITAPAEIIAESPTVVTVPYDGVLDNIAVQSGDRIQKDQPLFTMDTTDLKGTIETAKQALDSAEKSLSRIRRESLSTPEKKTEIAKISADISARKIEYSQAKIRLGKSIVTASNNGIAILSDASDYEGQPVRTGEKIMVLAEPENIELLIKIPVDAMIPITAENPIHFFLNVSPLSGFDATILSIGYQPSVDSDSLLTYKVRAKIKGSDDLRIGWKGTAKIQGKRTVLIYALIRRPLITLRHITGL